MGLARLPRALLVGTAGLAVLVAPLLVPSAASASASTLVASADAYVSTAKAARSNNYGTATVLETSAIDGLRSYLRFEVPAGTVPVTSAVLRIHATTTSAVGFAVSSTTGAWTESAITGRNAPAPGSTAGTSGSVTAGTWASVDITSLVRADGPVNLVLTAPSGGLVSYSSREAAQTAPQLVLTTPTPSPSPSLSSPPSPSASPSPSPAASLSPSPTLTQAASPSASPTVSPAGAASPSAPAGPSYVNAVRADAPLAYYRLGDPSTAAADSSGAGRNGTYSGGVTHPAGVVSDADTAATFDGTTGKVTVADDAAVRLSGAFTVEFWGRIDTFVGTYPGLLVKGTAAGPDGYLVFYSSTGQLVFKRNNVSTIAPAGTLTSAWRHFAATYDGATLRLYADGTQVAATTTSYPASVGTAPLLLGKGDSYGKHSLDEVALYDHALTAAQLNAHRTAASGTAPAPSPTAASASPSPSPTSASPSPTSTATPSPSPTFIGPVPPTATIAAVGDIACDPTDANYNGGLGTASFCKQRSVAALVNQGGYDAILPLGDEQYTDGTLAKFQQVYEPSWGSTKSLQRPVPGNHEYLDPNAAGYYAYYGAAAGDPAKGYYSYDLGAWHVVALNGECSYVGGCGAGTPQESWLKADLAAHPSQCTLAYWHEPKFTSTDPTNTAPFQTFWTDLRAAGAEIILNGHQHNYERFAPQTENAVADPNGIREFIVGTGGKGLVGFAGTTAANSEVRNSSTYGVLKLALKPGSYDWTFVPEAGKTFTDSGTTSCH